VKKLYRSQHARMVAGVCGGLAEYLDIDVTVVRLLGAFAIIASGVFPGLLFYLAAALIIPTEPPPSP
jgi:phage shock protein PspC (stress-responsive transcriptional regulator)